MTPPAGFLPGRPFACYGLCMTEPLVLVPVLSGAVFVLAGLALLRWPPRKINALYGYRTRASMVDQRRWDLAQRVSGREFVLWGGLCIPAGALGLVVEVHPLVGVLLAFVPVLGVCALAMLRTERALKRAGGEPA